MRKTLQPALLALCCALLFVTAGVAEEAVEFKPVWPVGKRFTFIDRQVMEQTFSIPNVPEPMQQKMSQTQKYSYSVLRETPGGGRELEMEFLSVKFQMEMAGREMSFDSETDTGDESADPLTRSMRHYTGTKLSIWVTPDGSVERVTGMTELMEKIMTSAGASPGAVPEMFNEEHFRQMFSHNFRHGLPGHPVKRGDTWPYEAAFPVGGTQLDLTLEFTFTDWTERDGHRCAQLDFEGEMTGSLAMDGGQNVPGMQMTVKESSLKGKKFFAPELGMAIGAVTRGNSVMEMTIPSPDGPQQTTSEMKQEQVIKLVSIDDVPPAAAEQETVQEPAPVSAVP